MQPDLPKKSLSGFVAKWQGFFELGGRLPPAYLLAGPEGSGHLEAAREMAQIALARENLPFHPDYLEVFPEKSSLKIEEIRRILRRLSLKPVAGGRIVVVIGEADSMTEAAANALLKTLEEPPDHVLFLLVTSKPDRLPATIRSRCQKISFHSDVETLRARFGELYATWRTDLKTVLEESAPSFARAAKLAETVAAQTERLPSLFEFLKAYWRDLAVVDLGTAAALLIPEAAASLRKKRARTSNETLFAQMDTILETERALEGNVNKTLALERMFMKLMAA